MSPVNSLPEQFARVRELTLKLCESLQAEDTVVQSMPDVSPTKWHLAHVTWFFERLVLEEFVSGQLLLLLRRPDARAPEARHAHATDACGDYRLSISRR